MEQLYNGSIDDLMDKYGIGMRRAKTPAPGPVYAPFRLPITYVPADRLHPLSPTVRTDMELRDTDGRKGMYHHLLRPSHTWGTMMMDEWEQQFTSHTPFLEEQQDVVQTLSLMPTLPPVDASAILSLWHETQDNPTFLEHYGYLDWKVLLPVNQDATAMQLMACSNLVSPLLSMCLPLLFLVVPFLILKVQGVTITFASYITILKDLAKNHFIGKALANLDTLSPDKVVYVGLLGIMYVMQMYQNVSFCQRFTRNLQYINEQLILLREFLEHSRATMGTFLSWHGNKVTFAGFCQDLTVQLDVVGRWSDQLAAVRPWSWSLSTLGTLGTLLTRFYEIHSDPGYETAFRYCMGWEGYLDNLRGIYQGMRDGRLHTATFVDASGSQLEAQQYPVIASDTPVTNTCTLDANMVLTGPNASGKTTLLKTTFLNVLFSQQVGCGFYRAGTLCPYTHLHSYLNIPDTSGRDSLFQAEARRCKDILDIIDGGDHTHRHFCIFDELYSGTNPVEAAVAARSFLAYLSRHHHVHFMLTTHYTTICKKLQRDAGQPGRRPCKNMKMRVEMSEDTGEFTYTYEMVEGISRVRGAKKVLMDLNYPDEIVSRHS